MSTPVELQRAKEQQLAATREDLSAKIKDVFYAARDASRTMHQAADDAVDAILSSGVLRDADEVRRADFAAIEARYRVEREKGRAEVRAAIEALCEDLDHRNQVNRRIYENGDPDENGEEYAWGRADGFAASARKLRALVADGGAAALREHDERMRQPLRDALARALSELGGKHSGHWDPTRQWGAGCPVCIGEREVRDELRQVLDTAGEAGDA